MTTTAEGLAAERGGLLADVLAHRAEDWPRLVMADWCEENGEPELAWFIREQLSPDYAPDWMEGMPRIERPVRGGWELTREMKLHSGLMPGFRLVGWDKDVVCYSPASEQMVCRIDVVFRRGFAVQVRAPLAELLAHLPAVVGCHPVEKVVASDKEPLGNYQDDTFRWYVRGMGDGRENRHFLPHVLSGVKGLLQGDYERVYRVYPTAEQGQKALSDALLALARGEA